MTAAGGAAATLSISNGKVSSSITAASGAVVKAKVNIDALTTAGLALKSTFIQTEQAMSGSLNSLLQLSSAGGQGAKGIREVDQAGKDYVASLLPLAQGSQDATTMLYGLAQQAGYGGVNSFKALAQWVGNIKNPMQQAETITQRLTVAAGNLATDVTNLANAINTNLATAMATAISGGSKVQTALDNMYTALHKNSDIMDGAVKKAAQNLAVSLLDDLGGNVDSREGEVRGFLHHDGREQDGRRQDVGLGGPARAGHGRHPQCQRHDQRQRDRLRHGCGHWRRRAHYAQRRRHPLRVSRLVVGRGSRP